MLELALVDPVLGVAGETTVPLKLTGLVVGTVGIVLGYDDGLEIAAVVARRASGTLGQVNVDGGLGSGDRQGREEEGHRGTSLEESSRNHFGYS